MLWLCEQHNPERTMQKMHHMEGMLATRQAAPDAGPPPWPVDNQVYSGMGARHRCLPFSAVREAARSRGGGAPDISHRVGFEAWCEKVAYSNRGIK
jgi:hypothetical protein